MESTINKRVVEAIEYLKKEKFLRNDAHFADTIGMSKSQLSRIKKGELSVTDSVKDGLCNNYNISFNWLLKGEGSMLRESPAEEPPKKRVIRNEAHLISGDKYMLVEYADLRASAGFLGGGDVDQLPESQTMLVSTAYGNRDDFLAVGIDGDSMDDGTSRSIREGDRVLVKRVYERLEEGIGIRNSLFIITTREGNVLKQIKEVNLEGRYLLCHSFNSMYDDYKIPFEDICQIFRVIEIIYRKVSL